MLAHQVHQSPRLHRPSPMSLVQLIFDRLGDLAYVGRLYKIIVNLLSNGLQRGFKCGISGKNEGAGLRMRAPHGTDNRKAVALAIDVQIRDESVELLVGNQTYGVAGICRRCDPETKGFKHQRQGCSNRLFVVHEENFWFHFLNQARMGSLYREECTSVVTILRL